jgi:hypothetical protein
MSKPVTPQEMFDLWQKMVNPGAYPLQSLMFPVLDSKELDRKIAELEVVEHWLKANVNMVALTIKSLQFQRDLMKGGEKAMKDADPEGEIPNPAMWAWNMMADAAKAMPQAPPATGGDKEKKRSRKR